MKTISEIYEYYLPLIKSGSVKNSVNLVDNARVVFSVSLSLEQAREMFEKANVSETTYQGNW